MSSISALTYNNNRNRNFLDEIDQNHIDRNDISNNNLPCTAEDKRNRKAVFRRTIDYNSSVTQQIDQRLIKPLYSDRNVIQPDIHYQHLLTPPQDYVDNPMNCVCAKHVRTSTNKNKCPIFSLCWTPDGRRLITGASSGEFTLWNGLTFNFETILQAHDTVIKAMQWSHNEEWLLSGDDNGMVKYWQANMNDVNVFQAHNDHIRGLSFCPSDKKFVTCSVDNTVRVWDFEKYKEERVLRGHGGEVKCVAWHPTKSLVLSGGKDSQQPLKLWDPKAGECISTLYAHKSSVNDISINKNGNWFLSASRDHTIKLFDLRNLREEMQVFRGHKKEVIRCQWHPVHENLLVSGGGGAVGVNGALMYWMVGTENEVGCVEDAHENTISCLDWHPMGHILATGSNDFSTKFWTRNRPGDVLKDNVQHADGNLGAAAKAIVDGSEAELAQIVQRVNTNVGVDNGVSLEHLDLQKLSSSIEADLDRCVIIPGLGEGTVYDGHHGDASDNDSAGGHGHGHGDDEDGDGNVRGGGANRTLHKQFALNWAEKKPVFLPVLEPVVAMVPMATVPPVVAASAAAVAPLPSLMDSARQSMHAFPQQLFPPATAIPNLMMIAPQQPPQQLPPQQQQMRHGNGPLPPQQQQFPMNNNGFPMDQRFPQNPNYHDNGRNMQQRNPRKFNGSIVVPLMRDEEFSDPRRPPPPHHGNSNNMNANQRLPPQRNNNNNNYRHDDHDGFEPQNQRNNFYPQQQQQQQQHNMNQRQQPPMRPPPLPQFQQHDYPDHGVNSPNRRPQPPPAGPQRNFLPNNSNNNENPFEPQKATGSSQDFIPLSFNGEEPPNKRPRPNRPGNRQGSHW